jgi:glutamate dehydrogenase
MSYEFEQGKDLIIDAVVERIYKKMSGKQAESCAKFVRNFYGTVALDDLQEWDIDDLYGAVINFWHLIYERAQGETKIRIYNPDFEKHGWQTTHTVIELVHDDMPFLVDSVRMEINRMGLTSHLIIHMGGMKVKRDKKNRIVSLEACSDHITHEDCGEAPIFIQIDRVTSPKLLDELYQNLESVLSDNRVVVQDWKKMRNRVHDAIQELDGLDKVVDKNELAEAKDFLHWIEDHHFTFLGVRDYKLVKKEGETLLEAIPGTGLGVLCEDHSISSSRNISAMTPEARDLTLSQQILIMSKTNRKATVHRDVYTDYVGVKRFDKKGRVIGECRIIGLYTSAAYNTNPKHIPFLRRKAALIMKNSKLNPKGHAGKVLFNILETLPRDDLIQGNEDEILQMAMGIFHLQERRRIRMFARQDVYRRFISCLVYVPKDRFNTELRHEMQKILVDSFNAKEVSFSTRFSESVLARIHFILRIDPTKEVETDYKKIEKMLIEVGRIWNDDFQDYLLESYGEEESNRLFDKYKNAFPVAYRDNYPPRTGVYDARHVEQITDEEPLGINFFQPMDDTSGLLRLKVYQHHHTIPLSDVLPILENLGMRAISERPYVLRYESGDVTWINDFSLQYEQDISFNIDEIKDLFQSAFKHAWFGDMENDGFNRLVLGAGLNWRQVAILRLYAKYFKQIGLTFSQDYIETALNSNIPIAKKLIQLFETQFNPKPIDDRESKAHAIVSEILSDLDEVSNLDQDKIIRQYVSGITSTLRTNFFQKNKKGKFKKYISIKLNTKTIPGAPLPLPMFEIFVYSPQFEGVHLRCGKVARGGLRWSDRKEDFRTEILGLMKAQQVKNSVIVPSGAKGGFVPKQLPEDGTREQIMAEGINCYRQFIRGLLDITDNYKAGEIIKPSNVICYDEDDHYLVVAADKGTATFSDIANEISHQYDFWLGDAFASGGSIGYDHKKMGITARGAWESVKRHFREMGRDIQTSDFTVVGIGDMAGDVFGNGMLLSKHINLVAAFNHMHIFIDPNPSTEESFKERERLFSLPRSTWKDYDSKLISQGGGVFDRSAKYITVTKEMKSLFGIKQSTIEPNELIKKLLKAPVDLLWSGGIGTFVKSESESHEQVGDRTNDGIRVNAKELQCKVVGEGGNLGLTQLARVEYALNGGLIYTDFIDNSAGVDCSDNEVNIKILLNEIVAQGDMTEKQRIKLLAKMTDEVAALVLNDNYQQTQAISLAAAQALRHIELHGRYIDELERSGKLDRSLEFLPDEKALMERKLKGKGMLRPGLAVLLCYSKTILNEQILESDVPEDQYLEKVLVNAFPKPLQKEFQKQMQDHPLKREIIATKLSNIIINEMGFTFVYRLQDETGASVAAVVRAYMIARTIFKIEEIWGRIQKLDNKIFTKYQIDMMMYYIRLVRRTTRWLLRSQRGELDIATSVAFYAPGVERLKKAIPQVFAEENKKRHQSILDKYLELGIDKSLAKELALTRPLFSALDIIEVAKELDMTIEKVAEVYFGVGEYLNLSWIRSKVIIHTTENHWESLSREALRDDLDWQQRQLTLGIIRFGENCTNIISSLESWSSAHKALIERWKYMLADLRSTSVLNYTMFFVAIRELLDLTQTTIQMVQKEDVCAISS